MLRSKLILKIAGVSDESIKLCAIVEMILSDEELAVEKVTLSTTGKAIEFAVSGGVVDGEDGVVNEPMQWVVTVYKNGKEIEKKSLVFRDGKEISTDDLNLYYN